LRSRTTLRSADFGVGANWRFAHAFLGLGTGSSLAH
jgi:hypothetical protein